MSLLTEGLLADLVHLQENGTKMDVGEVTKYFTMCFQPMAQKVNEPIFNFVYVYFNVFDCFIPT